MRLRRTILAILIGVAGLFGTAPSGLAAILPGTASALAENPTLTTSDQAVFSPKPHIGAIGRNQPETPQASSSLAAQPQLVALLKWQYYASGYTVAPRTGGYQTKVVNGRTYELRPSNGGTGPNRWHRVKPATTAGSQNHHLVSNPIVDALEEHAGISRETGLALRNNPALQKMSAPGGHVGYENWHRGYDRHMTGWIEEQGTGLKITDFFDEMNRYYQSGDAATRIPGVNLGAPQ